MAKERALTLEALRVMDAIDRRGSFAAAADELGRVPSALSYTMQKLEEELDVVLFDRSGHRTKFTNVGRMLLERGRVLLEAADKLTTDAEALARGWETHLTIVTEALVPTPAFFPLIDKLAAKANTQLAIITEVLAGAWERLEQGRADIVIAPDMHFRSSSEINSRKLYTLMNVYVAAPDHPIHQEPEPLSEVTRVKYRGIAVADTARERPVLTVQLLDKQPRLTGLRIAVPTTPSGRCRAGGGTEPPTTVKTPEYRRLSSGCLRHQRVASLTFYPAAPART